MHVFPQRLINDSLHYLVIRISMIVALLIIIFFFFAVSFSRIALCVAFHTWYDWAWQWNKLTPPHWNISPSIHKTPRERFRKAFPATTDAARKAASLRLAEQFGPGSPGHRARRAPRLRGGLWRGHVKYRARSRVPGSASACLGYQIHNWPYATSKCGAHIEEFRIMRLAKAEVLEWFARQDSR
jgi:hypothetical protein